MPLPFPLKFARLGFALVCGALLLPVMAGAQATQYKEAPPLLLGALPAAMSDLLKGGSVSSVDLDKYGVAVLEAR